MKVFVVLAIALACASAAVIPDSPVLLRNLTVEDGIEGRITNGITASPGQFPYQVALLLRSGDTLTFCGGSLIGNSWVLTAAHCTDLVTSANVYLGSNSLSAFEVSHNVSSDSIFQHTDFNSDTLTNDVALIKIPLVTYTSDINAIKLPAIASTYSTYDGSYAIASGWGRTADTSSLPNLLNYARLQVVTNTICAATYDPSLITDNTICVSTSNGTGTCRGDSGGPLVLETSGILIGITSFISPNGCAAGDPDGFVRVTQYLDWIKSNTGISY